MFNQVHSNGNKRVEKTLSVISLFFLSVLWGAASHAVTINFDDITFEPNLDGEDSTVFDDMPLTDEYASQGLLIEGGFLLPEMPVSPPNALLGGNLLTLRFINALPIFVSMRVNSVNDGAVILNAYGADGLIERQQTPGYAGPDDDTWTVPDLLVSFNAGEAITHITVENFYNTRTSAYIDDLTYEYSVPAPATAWLIAVGLFGLAAQRRRLQKR